jgi:Fic family protein
MFYIANLLGDQPDYPITQELICRLHELITKDVNYKNNVPGQYRSHSVNAGDYLPPTSGEEVRSLMSEFIDWFRSPPAMNWAPVIRALAAHFYVVSIHPFGDGNGRTSRALESFLLYQGKVNARGFYSLANYYYLNRTEYVWHLNNARFNSAEDLTPFIQFGLEGLVSELQAVHEQVIDEVKLISFRDYAREMFLHKGKLGTKAGERLFHFLIALGRDPVPVSEIRTRTSLPASLYKKVSVRTLQRDIAFLKDEGLVKIEGGNIIPNLELMEQFTALQELQAARGLLVKSQPTQARST